MKESFFHNDGNELRELVQQYMDLKNGDSTTILEEDAFVVVIDHFDEREQLVQALEAAAIGLECHPYSAQLMIKKADLLIADLRYHEALKLLDAAYLLDAGDINIFVLWIDAYLGMENQEEAARVWEEAIGHFEGEDLLELLFELADVYDDYEDFDMVFDCLVLILYNDPTNEEALYKICFWTDYTGRNEESIKLHQKIIDEYPYCELAWFNLAAAFQGLKLYEKAIDAYQYAITINDQLDYAYRNMGDAYMRLRKYKEAIEVLQKVLELTRPEDVIYEAIGHCYHRLHQYALARLHYRKASFLHPEDSKLFYKIALTYMDQNLWQQAILPLQSAMGITHAPEFNLAMGECQLQLGDFRQAIQYFGQVVRQRSRNIPGWEALIRCLYIAGYYEEAIEQSAAALKATEERPIFHFYQAMCYYALGDIQESLLHLEQGMAHAPRLFKKALELNPAILQNSLVVDVLARYKRARR